MNQMMRVSLPLLIAIVTISSLACRQEVTDPIAQSHIDANVPDQKDFRNFLVRDLQSYFERDLKRTVRADYELLREGPTQSGVSDPKYYAWVKVFDGDTLIEEGAVRVAAINKKQFEILGYLSKNDIKQSPAAIEQTFPRALIDAIKKKAEAE